MAPIGLWYQIDGTVACYSTDGLDRARYARRLQRQKLRSFGCCGSTSYEGTWKNAWFAWGVALVSSLQVNLHTATRHGNKLKKLGRSSFVLCQRKDHFLPTKSAVTPCLRTHKVSPSWIMNEDHGSVDWLLCSYKTWLLLGQHVTALSRDTQFIPSRSYCTFPPCTSFLLCTETKSPHHSARVHGHTSLLPDYCNQSLYNICVSLIHRTTLLEYFYEQQ